MSVKMLTMRYSGSLNGQNAKGCGAVAYDTAQKEVIGNIDLEASEVENEEGPNKTLVFSRISICCCNFCNIESANNNSIVTLSDGNYSSEREVELWDNDNIVADIVVNGFVRKITNEHCALKATISGFYNGPPSLNNVDGYQLPLEPEGENMLQGNFTKDIEGSDGKVYTLKHFHKYIFHDGVTHELVPMTHKLQVNTDESFISNEKKFFHLKGTSEILSK